MTEDSHNGRSHANKEAIQIPPGIDPGQQLRQNIRSTQKALKKQSLTKITQDEKPWATTKTDGTKFFRLHKD